MSGVAPDRSCRRAHPRNHPIPTRPRSQRKPRIETAAHHPKRDHAHQPGVSDQDRPTDGPLVRSGRRTTDRPTVSLPNLQRTRAACCPKNVTFTSDWFADEEIVAALPEWSYRFIEDSLIPALQENGVRQDQIDQMMHGNPIAFFEARSSGGASHTSTAAAASGA